MNIFESKSLDLIENIIKDKESSLCVTFPKLETANEYRKVKKTCENETEDPSKFGIDIKIVKYDSISLEIDVENYIVTIYGKYYITKFINEASLKILPKDAYDIVKIDKKTEPDLDKINDIKIEKLKYEDVNVNDIKFNEVFKKEKNFKCITKNSYKFNSFVVNLTCEKRGRGMKFALKTEVHRYVNIMYYDDENSDDMNDFKKLARFILISCIRDTVYEKDIKTLNELKKSMDHKDIKDRSWYAAPKTVTLTRERYESMKYDMSKSSNAYTVTTKTDGLRMVGYIHSDQFLYLQSKEHHLPHFTRVKFDKKFVGSIIDGEFVSELKDKTQVSHYLIFDIYKSGEEDLHSESFDTRQERLTELMKTEDASKSDYNIIQKEFKPISNDTIFNESDSQMRHSLTYHIDGLIYTSTKSIIDMEKDKNDGFLNVFKWKDADTLSVDFKVVFDKIEKKRIKVGNDIVIKDYQVCDIHLNNRKEQRIGKPINYHKFIEGGIEETRLGVVSFQPFLPENEDASKLVVEREQNKIYCKKEFNDYSKDYSMDYSQEITNTSIVECTWHSSRKVDGKKIPGKWIPIRIRQDKLYPNDYSVGIDIWKSLNEPTHEPITKDMITGIEEIPPIDEKRRIYYSNKERFKSKKTSTQRADDKTIRAFHRLNVKARLFSRIGGKNSKLLDICSGCGADSPRYLKYFDEVVGIDLSYNNIENGNDGAYKLLNLVLNDKRVNTYRTRSKYTFLVGDASKPFEDPKTFSGIYENIARAKDLFATTQTFDAMTSMFSIHYMFENETKFKTLIMNIHNNVKIGGYFAGCTYDGEKINEDLQTDNEINIEIGNEKDKRNILKITRDFKKDMTFEPNKSSLGKKINVRVASIGSAFPEYLVNFKYLIKVLENIGFDVIHTDTFKKIYDSQDKIEGFDKFVLTEDEQIFSFLYRSFVFKRNTVPKTIPDISILF